MKLSVLILTHNRPKLFTRAIMSVLNNLPEYNIEIIVNNDTHDIDEIYSDVVSIQYYYHQHDDLSSIYKNLFYAATGEYIFYLEDDDYIRPNFFTNLDLADDLIFMEYISEPLISKVGAYCSYKIISKNREHAKYRDIDMFIDLFDDEEFQLSQICFRKNLVDTFPSGNNLNNDYELFKHIAKNCKNFKYINEQMWVQTTDGNDNISFPALNNQTKFYNG